MYLICPTDCLESTINQTFKDKNYFYTSLVNSFNYDDRTLEYISSTIIKHNIKEICFVLSIDNNIVIDALERNYFLNIEVLRDFYNEITIQKEHSKTIFKKSNLQFAILSYYLNKKIKELKLPITSLLNHPIKIVGKIYSKDKNIKSRIT